MYSGVFGKIHSRSGLALKKGISAVGGVIDKNYTGDIGVILMNHGSDDFVIKKGDRIAQLVVHVILTPEVVEVDDISSTYTTRSSNGFGSSGN